MRLAANAVNARTRTHFTAFPIWGGFETRPYVTPPPTLEKGSPRRRPGSKPAAKAKKLSLACQTQHP